MYSFLSLLVVPADCGVENVTTHLFVNASALLSFFSVTFARSSKCDVFCNAWFAFLKAS
eukprot:CAMPEP_0115330312 /NCGR_PEP_ID=MMETSP0270-20121206/85708_1 /TAXON_ID=71861 /ORGANISM="Scrippsiella trochoidea, Strain CCMP3099" /LENGTH=58 /DNA_ID=CAMNT_0002751015 /DNA_START=263 /DNA_END=439 /DNA_ORIENTATION=+